MTVMIGPRMKQALRILAGEPGGAIRAAYPLAKAIGPHGSTQFGYATVQRLVAAGLVRVDPHHPDASPTGNGAIILTPLGWDSC